MSLSARLSDFTIRAVAAAEPTLGQRAWRGVLATASVGFGVGAGARNAAYTLGLLPVRRLPCRVICVGNLTVGGTGKTPAVIALARRLTDAGSKVCVLLRGYGRSGTSVGVVSDGRDRLLDWPEAGDEAILLARRLPGVPVIVGGDRIRAGRLALRRFGPETILLDDGFQHRRLWRDLDLVLLDATDPFGGGRLLPRGRLREPPSGLRRAHAILITRADQAADLDPLRRRLQDIAPGVPVGVAVHRPGRLVDLGAGQEAPPDRLRRERVFAASGIASPRSFHQTLRDLGAPLAGMLAFPDHHPFGPEDRARIAREAHTAGATCIVTTEKDAVRLRGELLSDLPILALGIELEVVEGAGLLERLLGVAFRGAGGG